jgi:NitT/TauT family transport system substrate-binding protein
MRGFTTTAFRVLLVLAIGYVASSPRALLAGDAPQVAVKFTFDRPLDASTAPFFIAAKDGRFGAEHLNVAFNHAAGSQDAIARVAGATAISPWSTSTN